MRKLGIIAALPLVLACEVPEKGKITKIDFRGENGIRHVFYADRRDHRQYGGYDNCDLGFRRDGNDDQIDAYRINCGVRDRRSTGGHFLGMDAAPPAIAEIAKNIETDYQKQGAAKR